MNIIKCKYNFEECENKLKNQITKLGATVFFEVDHKKNAEQVGLSLNKCKVIYFGNPKVGTLLMQKKIEVSYDLPLRISLFEKDGEVFIEYRMPEEIAKDYGIENDVVKKMNEFMANVISSVE